MEHFWNLHSVSVGEELRKLTLQAQNWSISMVWSTTTSPRHGLDVPGKIRSSREARRRRSGCWAHKNEKLDGE